MGRVAVMATHPNTQSMLYESLPEMLLAAKYCIESRKDIEIWPAPGCYGYPAALILLSIADSIGSYVENGKVENHFKILNNPEYYNLDLDERFLQVIYKYYRNTLTHNSVLTPNISLDIGQPDDRIFEEINNIFVLNLVPFYNLSVLSVNKLLNNPQVLSNNPTISNIEKKNSSTYH